MKNPILEARNQLGLGIKDFALVAGVTEQTIRWNERGDNVSITPKLLTFLTAHGFNKEDLEEKYNAFRAWKKKQLLKSLQDKKRA
jgi:DNA-binding XRE family transcriptional regulator